MSNSNENDPPPRPILTSRRGGRAGLRSQSRPLPLPPPPPSPMIIYQPPESPMPTVQLQERESPEASPKQRKVAATKHPNLQEIVQQPKIKSDLNRVKEQHKNHIKLIKERHKEAMKLVKEENKKEMKILNDDIKRLMKENIQLKIKLASFEEEVKVLRQQQEEEIILMEQEYDTTLTNMENIWSRCDRENERLKEEMLTSAYKEVFGLKDEGRDGNSDTSQEENGMNQNAGLSENDNQNDDDDDNHASKRKKRRKRKPRSSEADNSEKDDANGQRRKKRRLSESELARYEALWNERYELMKDYKRINGDCEVPKNLSRDDTFWPLRSWVSKQRDCYKNEKKDGTGRFLSPERERLLNEIGFSWKSGHDESRWQEKFEKLLEFKTINGHFDVPTGDPEWRALSAWVTTQRKRYIKEQIEGTGKYMPPERERMLNEIGFTWNAGKGVRVDWNTRFQQLLAFREKHGHCCVPRGDKETELLCKWVYDQRSFLKQMKRGKVKYRGLTEHRIKLLDSIGFDWNLRRNHLRKKASTQESEKGKASSDKNEDNFDDDASLEFSL